MQANALQSQAVPVRLTRDKKRLLLYAVLSSGVLFALFVASALIQPEQLLTNFRSQHASPSWTYPFGTDRMGRDMLWRVIRGMAISCKIGLLATCGSIVIALLLSLVSSRIKIVANLVDGVSNILLVVPHLLLLMIISYIVGNGEWGLVTSLAVTHWVTPMRYLSKEMLQMHQLEYIQVSRFLGKHPLWIIRHHYLPLIMPRVFLSAILLFPHVLLHEAALTFLGFGLKSSTPAIGNILSDAMGYLLRGSWWLVVFPGGVLVLVTICMEVFGSSLKQILLPNNQ
ncbi:ABC transporter permease [Aerococcaceae bacterium NML191292]|nr:ABC transporter permease [Aerococcaceae bacterium NML191292]MCW6675001.1 ABC transporter permease [Aerococcaceae bacterium NML171108]MDO4774696.1 ABC transporter permease [Aerococcaceae bacterium]